MVAHSPPRRFCESRWISSPTSPDTSATDAWPLPHMRYVELPSSCTGAKWWMFPAKEAIHSFGAGDAFIKGASCLDLEGRAGILMANDRGGTTAMVLGPVPARGSHLLVPVGPWMSGVVRGASWPGPMAI